jgi:hypothetical protein
MCCRHSIVRAPNALTGAAGRQAGDDYPVPNPDLENVSDQFAPSTLDVAATCCWLPPGR